MSFSFFSKQFLCGLLIMLFIIPMGFLLQPKPVYAIGGVGDATVIIGNTDPATIEAQASGVVNAINTAGTWVSTKLLEVKEYILNGLAFAVVNTLIEMMTRDILTWINSGFKGNPAFIQDPSQFFLDVGDQVTGEFLQGSDLALLCSPFALQVKIALANYRGRTGRYQCTLSRIVTNTNGFLNNISSADTWNSWLQISSAPQNNPYGAFMMANDELSVRVGNTVSVQSKLLDWGRGLFSVPDPSCSKQSESSDGGSYSSIVSSADCPKVTPGAAIESELNANLDSGRQRLIVATSFNQIVSALLVQLAKTAITGAGGLLGLSGSTHGSSGSSYAPYLAQLGSQQMAPAVAQSIGQSASTDINDVLASEIGINDIKSNNYSMLLGAQTNLEALKSCYQNRLVGAPTDSTDTSTTQTNLTETNGTLINISARTASALGEKNSSANLINAFSPIQNTLQTQPSSSTEYQNALFQYQQLRLNSTFHTPADVDSAKRGQQGFQDEITSINNTTNTRLQQCTSAPAISRSAPTTTAGTSDGTGGGAQ